jgi:RNA polymerase sigma factor (sigma-70 family)
MPARGGTAVLGRSRSTARQRRNAESLRLVAQFQAGDPEAFSELYELWAEALMRFLWAELGDRHAAEDHLQQVVETLLKDLGRYEARPNVPFERWLFRIARFRVLRELRRRRVSVLDPDEIAAHLERDRMAPDVAERVERWALDGALERLTLSQRQVLTLRFRLDLKTAEIAHLLGMSEAAVYKAEQRGLRALKVVATSGVE